MARIQRAGDGAAVYRPGAIVQYTFNFNLRIDQAPNVAGILTRLAAYKCPSDVPYPIMNPAGGFNGSMGGPGVNYLMSAGPTVGGWQTQGGPAMQLVDEIGFVNYRKHVGVRDMTDGTSNVIAAAESTVGNHATGAANFDLRRSVVRGIAFPGGVPMRFWSRAQLDAYGQSCLAGTGNIHGHARQQWAHGLDAQTILTTMDTPNSKNPDCQVCTGCSSFDSQGVFTARSLHTGGVHVLMGDGAVKFVSDNVDLLNWQRAGGINDGGTIGDF